MDIRKAHLMMIGAYPGGWDAMAAALGMSRDALENRIYERKGQGVLNHTSMQMQAFSGTDYFAQAVAQESGGVFIKLPEADAIGNDELLAEFNKLYSKLGELSAKFQDYVRDDEITRRERADLESVAQEIHKTIRELMGLMFKVYCKPGEAA